MMQFANKLYRNIGGEVRLSSSYFIYGETAPVHMSNVQCSGTESRLTECPYTSGGSGSDASLYCDYYYYYYSGIYRIDISLIFHA